MDWNRFEIERKYAPSPDRADELVAAAKRRLTPRIYDPQRPIAYARTTYLDTDDFRYLRSAEGPMRRRLRVREYAGAPRPGGPIELTGARFLELKISARGRRTKTRLAAAADEIERQLGGLGVAPTLRVWYRRLSLTDPDERVRLTVDTEIDFYRPHRDRPSAHGPACIVEVKHYGDLPAWLEQLLEPLGDPQPLSKYDLGIRALRTRETLPGTRFARGSACPPVGETPSD